MMHRSLRRRRALLLGTPLAVIVVLLVLPLSATIAAEKTPARQAFADPAAVATVAAASADIAADPPADVSSPAPAPPEPVAAPAPAPDPCREALDWVADAGLVLPAGVQYNCPSTQFAHHGAACWDEAPCRRTALIAINLDLIGDRGPDYLHHVVAHEICHILDYQAGRLTSEAGADACAAAHGAPG